MVRLGNVYLNTESENPAIHNKEILYIDSSAISSIKRKISEYAVISSKTASSRAIKGDNNRAMF